MKKFDLIKIINNRIIEKYNLPKDIHGVILDINDNNCAEVLLFNPNNVGDYIILKINNSDFVLEKEKLPKNIQKELYEHLRQINQNAKTHFNPQTVKEYDRVELLVEKEKYAKFGVHKGAQGFVMDAVAVGNNIIVDFSYVDEDGNFFGDCISANIKDLKVINKNGHFV